MLQDHPRPWPFAKLRTLWVPAHKVQGTKTDNAVLTFYLAFSLGGVRASCHLRHSVPDKEAVHVRVAPVGGFLVLHSRAGSARRQRPGSRQSRQPRLRRRSSKVSRHGVSACLSTDAIPPASASCRRGRHLQKPPGIRGAARWAAGAACASHHDGMSRPLAWIIPFALLVTPCAGCTVFPGLSANIVLPSFQRRHGPFRPGPWRPSAFPASRRALAYAPDRLQGHTLRCATGPWWFRDSGPGARGKVLNTSHSITRSTVQAQRLKTTKVCLVPTLKGQCLWERRPPPEGTVSDIKILHF